MTKDAIRSRFECEYLVGDDCCNAIRESTMGTLRTEECRNEVKDACCYLCGLRRTCDIRCDLPKRQRTMKERESAQLPKPTETPNAVLDAECGNCAHYIRPKCPRGYDHDTELLRRQEPCELFEPSKTISGKQ
ncbi:MAG: hypothetical protein ABSD73_07090 [Candidatus Bathyarchaeia archaeon]